MNISTSLMTNIIILMNERKYYTIICSFSCENEQMYFHFIVKYKANENEFSHSKKYSPKFSRCTFFVVRWHVNHSNGRSKMMMFHHHISMAIYTHIIYDSTRVQHTHMMLYAGFFSQFIVLILKIIPKIFYQILWNFFWIEMKFSTHTNSRAV